MQTHATNRAPLFWLMVILLLIGCEHRAEGAANTGVPGHGDQMRLQTLARDYVGKVTDEPESLQIRKVIRDLEPAEARYFHDRLGELNHYRGTDKLVFDLMFEESVRQRKSFLDLNDADLQRVIQSLKAPAPTTNGPP